MTDDKEQINILVRPERKAEWQEYAEKEHGSLTHLIRHSVQREIAGANDPAQSGSVPDDLQETLSSLESGNESIQSELRGVKRELRDVKSAVEQPDESIRDVANRILDVLPETRDPPMNNEVEAVTDPDHPTEAGNPPDTVDALADELDEPTDVVIEAIDMLETGTHMVRSSERDDGPIRYWRDS